MKQRDEFRWYHLNWHRWNKDKSGSNLTIIGYYKPIEVLGRISKVVNKGRMNIHFSYSIEHQIICPRNDSRHQILSWVENGYIDVGDGCWRRNLLVTTLRSLHWKVTNIMILSPHEQSLEHFSVYFEHDLEFKKRSPLAWDSLRRWLIFYYSGFLITNEVWCL